MRFEADTVLDPFGRRALVVLTKFGPVTALGETLLPWYHRLDARFTKDVPTSRGKLSFFVDLFNVFDTTNPAAYDYDTTLAGGRIVVTKVAIAQIGRLPSAGISWEF